MGTGRVSTLFVGMLRPPMRAAGGVFISGRFAHQAGLREPPRALLLPLLLLLLDLRCRLWRVDQRLVGLHSENTDVVGVWGSTTQLAGLVPRGRARQLAAAMPPPLPPPSEPPPPLTRCIPKRSHMLRLTLARPRSETVASTDTAPLNTTSPSLAMAVALLRQPR